MEETKRAIGNTPTVFSEEIRDNLHSVVIVTLAIVVLGVPLLVRDIPQRILGQLYIESYMLFYSHVAFVGAMLLALLTATFNRQEYTKSLLAFSGFGLSVWLACFVSHEGFTSPLLSWTAYAALCLPFLCALYCYTMVAKWQRWI